MSTARILVVDDNEDSALVIAEALRALGHEVAVALDGAQALERADAFGPDVVVLDLMLPRLDGYEVARRLRERDHAPRLIALSGWTQKRDRERTLAAGFDEHLAKPVTLEALEAAIGRPPA